MALPCSGDLNLSFEYPFGVLNLLVDERNYKTVLRGLLVVNLLKNDKSPGRNLKKIVLPNKNALFSDQ